MPQKLTTPVAILIVVATAVPILVHHTRMWRRTRCPQYGHISVTSPHSRRTGRARRWSPLQDEMAHAVECNACKHRWDMVV